MDDAVARLERARERDPHDASVTVDLARALVRAGRPLRALAVLGPLDAAEREFAGRALAAALELEWVGVVGGSDRFVQPLHRRDLVLVPAGVMLGDAERALTEERPRVPAFLAELAPHGVPQAVAASAVTIGGRLPGAREWLKLWRGGLFLDGDESRRAPNPDPARLLPEGFTVTADAPVRSAYGAHFVTDEAELVGGWLLGVFHTSLGRWFIRVDERGRRGLVARAVLDVPPEL